MDTHNLSSFQRPYLRYDQLQLVSDEAFEIRYQEVELTISAGNARSLMAQLESLRTPDAPLWREVPNDRALFDLLDSLQHYGFVYEHGHAGSSAQGMSALYHEVYAELQQMQLPPAATLQSLQAQLAQPAAFDDVSLLRDESNLFLLALRLGIKAWTQICPPVLGLFSRVLESVAEGQCLPYPAPELECYAASEARRCALVFLWCLQRSTESDAERLIRDTPECADGEPGLNLALLTERWATQALQQVGESPFVAALAAPETCLRMAQASYAQEYYITDRFIDIIAPAIAHRVARPLKKLIRKYYAEETGHDKYELKTCQRLGLKYEDLQTCLPTPFSQLICDIYTYLASNDPISYFAAITITEGLPGQPNILNSVVAESGTLPASCNHDSRHHEMLNENLHHPMISRIFLAECGKLNRATTQRALLFYATLLEIGWRSWNELYRMHVQQNKPALNFTFADYLGRQADAG